MHVYFAFVKSDRQSACRVTKVVECCGAKQGKKKKTANCKHTGWKANRKQTEVKANRKQTGVKANRKQTALKANRGPRVKRLVYSSNANPNPKF